MTGLFVGFVGCLMLVGAIGYAIVGMPDPAKAATSQNNVFYWSDGTRMVATGGDYNRQNIGYDDMPDHMRNAVISAENKTFWKDRGVDPVGISRAIVNMARGGEKQGGSTITQQYVKNALLNDQSQTVTRKFKELLISIKVGANTPKKKIITDYLNTAYFGRGAYGVQAASQAYFGKDAEELKPSQSAMLAAVLKGTDLYDPAGGNTAINPGATPEANLKRCKERWKWILDEEAKDHPEFRAERAKIHEFPKTKNPRSNSALKGQTGYLVQLAKAWVVSHSDETGVTQQNLEDGGYQITTTFDKKKVGQLEKSVAKVRKENIKPKLRPDKDSHVQFGGASVNPSTGAIEAIYGGEDATKHFTNNADQTGAQVGSTFKPFVLAAAMRDGVQDETGPCSGPTLPTGDSHRTIASPESLYSGKNKFKIKCPDGTPWRDKDGKEWLQTNDGDESVGDKPAYMIDLRKAMEKSVNTAYVQLGMDVGLDKVKDAALDAGVLEDSLASSAYPSFSIGTSDPSAIRMASAYSTFAADGAQHDPYSVEKVESDGEVVFDHKNSSGKEAFSPEVAHNVTSVLKNVVDKGTGTNAKLPNRQVAGKTGTTDGNKSAWFVGYTPKLSTAISMYRLDDDEKNTHRHFLEMYGTGGQKQIHGASFPSEIWHDYMSQALKGTPPEAFPPAEPIGEAVGTPPSPTASPSPTDSATASPSPSNTPQPSPSQSQTCPPLQPCNDGGNGYGGGMNGGTDGGTSTGTTDGGTGDGGTTNGGTDGGTTTGNNGGGDGGVGGDGGGWFGGPSG